MKISTGWPNELEPFVDLPSYKKDGKQFRDHKFIGKSLKVSGYEPIIEDELKTLLPSLEELTKLDMTYVAQSKETLENYANVRIVLVANQLDSKTREKLPPKFKKDKDTRQIFSDNVGSYGAHSPITYDFYSSVEYYLSDAVYFTPQSDRQVEGYFIPNGKNEIAFAVCYLWEGHEESIVRALVRECIVRALGLPDINPYHKADGALLSIWNNDNARDAKNLDMSGKRLVLTEYDRAIISTLYDPAIRSGMSAFEVQEVLLGMEFK